MKFTSNLVCKEFSTIPKKKQFDRLLSLCSVTLNNLNNILHCFAPIIYTILRLGHSQYYKIRHNIYRLKQTFE